MLIHGSPVAVTLASDPSFQDRFWYWSGASGRKYIHSVYGIEDCPPLPGAIYVAVKRKGSLRVAVAVGRFQPFWDHVVGAREARRFASLGVDELHVHLLGKTPAQTETVFSDLLEAFEDRELPMRTAAVFSRGSEAASVAALSV
jgi:hypothetical protein